MGKREIAGSRGEVLEGRRDRKSASFDVGDENLWLPRPISRRELDPWPPTLLSDLRLWQCDEGDKEWA